MKRFDKHYTRTAVADEMRRRCHKGTFNGVAGSARDRRYLNYCTGLHFESGTCIIFTRDVGMHSSGFLKNPDYERCYHLSLSYRNPLTGEYVSHDRKQSVAWLRVFFGDWERYIWSESPKSEDGQAAEVWHFRVFCDAAWQPMIPRKELYSKQYTPANWKSFSDLQWDRESDFQQRAARGRYAQ